MKLKILRQTVLVAAIGALCASTGAFAEPIIRSNWVPNVGSLAEGEQPLGDLWTFNCPEGGSVSVTVDTKDDTDNELSDIDPVLFVLDGEGNVLASADDNVACTYELVCAAGTLHCPFVTEVACGNDDNGNKHSLIVRDFHDNGCHEGGGYKLTVEVFRANGSQLSERRVGLGGGPTRKVPKFALDLGKAPVGPALDDEDSTLFSASFAATLNGGEERRIASSGPLRYIPRCIVSTFGDSAQIIATSTQDG